MAFSDFISEVSRFSEKYLHSGDPGSIMEPKPKAPQTVYGTIMTDSRPRAPHVPTLRRQNRKTMKNNCSAPNPIVSAFLALDEPYAAGLFEAPEKGYFYRHCCALASWFEHIPPVSYVTGERLYPGKNRYFTEIVRRHAVCPHYAHTWEVDFGKLENKIRAAGPEAGDTDGALRALREFRAVSHFAGGWLHGAPNYRRIVREGFASYRRRLQNRPSADRDEEEFRAGLLRLLDGMETYANRCRAFLLAENAPKELTDALAVVPFHPAETLYQGIVSWNTVFYFDGCDSLGCLDQGVGDLWRGEDMTDVIGELFSNVDAVDMWSCSVGGPVYNEITRQAIRAIRGKRRPMLELRVADGMPEDLWALAAENLVCGSSNPAFYNEAGIRSMLSGRFPQIPDEDLRLFCGCGCTETNFEGLTRAGGTDADVNLAKVFETCLYDRLAGCATFDEFFEDLCRAEEKATDDVLNAIEANYAYTAEYQPHPMRSLLWDDCIEKARDYNGGGARYTWTMNSESGLINVIDSLAAVRELVFEKKRYTPKEFLTLLAAEDPAFFAELKTCPCFGKDDDSVDLMGAEFARRVFMVYRNKKPKLAFLDGFTLTEHQFLRYEGCGACVGPTPDGRHRGQPTCDSVAALRGKAVDGPTAMLRSAAKLPQNLVDGISVLNLTLVRRVCESADVLRALVNGYFALGGIQVQITVTSPEELKDALAHPERHGDLFVRVGGYNEYFNRLSPALRQTVVERNVHDLNG